MPKPTPRIRMIVGPTASGKTKRAIEAALERGGEVISADSRCVYRRLDIGTAKPTADERKGVAHHFIDERNLGEPFSAGRFASEAETRIYEILNRGRLPIVAGGSTLYLSALKNGIAEMPDVPERVRNTLVTRLTEQGLPPLVAELQRLDPDLVSRIDVSNPMRVLRGLEVYEASGTPLSVWQRQRSAPAFAYEVELLAPPLDVMDERINRRVEAMVDAGWLDEVVGLLREGVSPLLEPLRTIGYREMADVALGQTTLPEAVSRIQLRTRQYARRQLTFFRGRSFLGEL